MKAHYLISVFFLCLFQLNVSISAAQSDEPLRVDLDMWDMQPSRVNEPGWNSWPAGPAAPVLERSFGGTTVAFSSNGNGNLTAHWDKAGIVRSRLASDGIYVQNFSGEACIEMRISGLTPGRHSLTTFHNVLDNPSRSTFSPMTVTCNGNEVHTAVSVPVRVSENGEALKLYTVFEVGSDGQAVFTFRAEPAEATNKNVYINGFEIDGADRNRQAQFPLPVNRDEHVDADSGTVTLSWQPAAGMVSHDLYVGTDRESVRRARRNSAEYKGNRQGNAYELRDLYTMDTYWWRVDGVDAEGNVVPGEPWVFRPRQTAFEGAGGHGRYARGGRGGKVVHVTDLRDDPRNPPEGSLRWALKQHPDDPITIVFDVAGMIDLKARLVLNRPYVTVAGQTAPGKGICIRYYPFGLSGADDAIVRFMRVRVGALNGTSDGMGLNGCNHAIVDHCSISWTTDEAFSSRSARNITLQNTLISEALNMANHKNYGVLGRHGYAASIGGDIGSFHHNLLAHCYGRNWSLAGGLDPNGFYAGRLDIFDNVVYNWGTRTTDGGAHEVNFVNNYYKPGPSTVFKLALNAQWDGFPGSQRYYTSGNIVEGIHEDLTDPRNACYSDPRNPDSWVDRPFFPSLTEIHSAAESYKRVLSDVGATQPALDDHDRRILRETLDGSFTYTGSRGETPGIPDDESDVGAWEEYPEVRRPSDFDSDGDGMPDWWERLHGTNLYSPAGDFSESNADADRDGYTALEDYLSWLAAPHYDLPAKGRLELDLGELARGFTDKAVYTHVDSENCSVKVRKGRATVKAGRVSGLASLTFRVTDGDGVEMTRRIGFRVVE